jgi:hypothetical protein
MRTKAEALAELRAVFERWELALAARSEDELVAPRFDDGWSIKDMLAHLWVWQQRSIARLEAALEAREPRYPVWPAQFAPEQADQPHDLNAWLYAQSRDTPWSAVYAAWHSGFLRLLELAAAIPDEDLHDPARYPWLEGYPLIAVLEGSHEHHVEHLEYLAT